MALFLNKPSLICWLAIPVLIGIGLLLRRHSVGIQLYDTYVFIGNLHFTLVASLLLFLIGMSYWLIDQRGQSPNRLFAAVYLLLTIGSLLLLTIPSPIISIQESTLLISAISALFLAQLVNLVAMSIRLFWV